MSKIRKFQSNKITLIQQYNNLKFGSLSKNGYGEFFGKYFFWEFDAKPSELSKVYRVLIIFHIDNYSPDIYVLDNEIWELSKNKSIPHLYDSEKIKLCLYYPAFNEWSNIHYMNNTIVTWTYLWLFYFEEWLYSDNWKGGGRHPRRVEDKEEKTNNKVNKKTINKGKIDKQDKAKYIIDKLYINRKTIYIQNLANNQV